MSNTDSTIANTILQQMGGAGRIKAMTGAKQFIALEHGVYFKFPQSNRKLPNSVRIVLTPTDEYDVTFHRITAMHVEETAKLTGMHAEDLKPLFEKTTGLYLSL